jgi:signal peptidase I
MLLRRLSAFFLDILEVVVFAIAIFLFMYLLVLQPHKIKGSSMEPNFPNGEYLLTDKVTYRFKDPKRGDVVVFQAPLSESDEFIKRIIALPNERISVREGKVFINGLLLRETYLSDTVKTDPGSFLSDAKEVLIPEDHYVVFGDNRVASSDSRIWGFVHKDRITGRAWVVYWPPQSTGLIEAVYYDF